MQIENAIPWWNVEVLSFAFHLTFREPTSLRIWIENNLEGLDFFGGEFPTITYSPWLANLLTRQ